MVPGIVSRLLRAAGRGVVVLALDGLSYAAAEPCLPHARVRPLRSTFPSTSTTAWLTAVTGVGAHEHAAIGMVYRAPGARRVTHLVDAGPPDPANRLIEGGPTMFERCAHAGPPAVTLGAELTRLTGEWATAVLRGARRLGANGRLSTDAVAVARRTIRQVSGVLAAEPARLVWAYVNLDDHVHRAGYDPRLRAAVRLLDEAACRWADLGWTVLAHADHGQVPVVHSADLRDAWDRLSGPELCRMPGGGAGRVRWLYPRPGRERSLAADLADALGDHADVLTPAGLADRGLLPATPAVIARIGEVVAVAASPRFPVPDPSVAFEHGAITDEEMLVPLAAWTAATADP